MYQTEPSKQCGRCHAEKPLSDFYRHPRGLHGRSSHCKKCHAALVKANAARPEVRARKAELARAFRNSPEGRAYTKALRQSPKGRANQKRERQSEKGKARMKRHLERDKQSGKYYARLAVQNAVRYGKMPRVATLQCSQCGNQATGHHHYKGYAKENWLQVIPVCYPCHKQLDLNRIQPR